MYAFRSERHAFWNGWYFIIYITNLQLLLQLQASQPIHPTEHGIDAARAMGDQHALEITYGPTLSPVPCYTKS